MSFKPGDKIRVSGCGFVAKDIAKCHECHKIVSCDSPGQVMTILSIDGSRATIYGSDNALYEKLICNIQHANHRIERMVS